MTTRIAADEKHLRAGPFLEFWDSHFRFDMAIIDYERDSDRNLERTAISGSSPLPAAHLRLVQASMRIFKLSPEPN